MARNRARRRFDAFFRPRRCQAERKSGVRPMVWLALLFALLPITAAAADDPLVRAAAGGDMAAVRALVKQGHDVNATGPDGATALHWAVRADDLATVDALIRAGARVDVRNALGVHARLRGRAERQRGDPRAAFSMPRADVNTADAAGRHAVDGRGAGRERGRGAAAARTGRGRERRRSRPRPDPAHVGGAPEPHRHHAAAAGLGRIGRRGHARRSEARGAPAGCGRRIARRRYRPQRRAAARRAGAGARWPDAAAVCRARRAARRGEGPGRGRRRREQGRPERHHAAADGDHQRPARRWRSSWSNAAPT